MFGLGGILATSVSGVASPPPYKIAVSHAIAETFPQILTTLNFLARQPGSPIEVHSGPVRLVDQIGNKFKDFHIVVAFASEEPRVRRDFVVYEPARPLEAMYLAASEYSRALSQLTNQTILHPDYREFKLFADKVVDTCLFSQQAKISKNKYLPIKEARNIPNQFHGLIIKTLMNHKYVFYESLIFHILNKKDLKFIPFYTDNEKDSFLTCLKEMGGYRFEETSIPSLHGYADLIRALHLGSGAPESTLQVVVKAEQIRLYMNESSFDDFRSKFFPFLYESFSEFKEIVKGSTPLKDILKTYALGYELITDRNRGVIEVANIWYYWPGKFYWDQLSRKRILESLGKKKGLRREDRHLTRIAIEYFNKYFEKMDELPTKKIELETLEARRMLAYLQYFLHHDARNQREEIESRDWLRLTHATIDEYKQEIVIVEKSNQPEYRELKRSDRFEELADFWLKKLNVLRRIPK